jgi:hypothetical protein
MDNTQREQLVKHLARRLGKLDDERLGRVELLTRPHDTARAESVLSRRFFIKLALLGGATAAGAAALKVAQTPLAGAPVTAQLGALPGGAVVQTAAGDQSARIAELLAELDRANGEIVGLRGSLSDSSQQVLDLQGQLGGTQNVLSTTRDELAQSVQNNQLLRGLVGLYEQLDAIDLDNTVLGGLAAAGEQLGNALDHSAVVQAGVDVAHQALDTFEQAFPPVKAGLDWLGAVIAWLTERVHGIETTIGQTVAAGRAFSDMLGAFFIKILSLLPFGWGDPIKNGLDAIGVLLNGVPTVAQGVDDYVLAPLNRWFDPQHPENISATVIAPVKQQALDPAAVLVTKVASAQSAYAEQLDAPARTAVSQRQNTREQIARYRQDNQV